MKKLVYVFIFGTIISLNRCAKKDEMVDYIPASMDISKEAGETPVEAGELSLEGDDETTNEHIDTAMKTNMYVRLDEFGAFLNIRKKPSREGQAVGH